VFRKSRQDCLSSVPRVLLAGWRQKMRGDETQRQEAEEEMNLPWAKPGFEGAACAGRATHYMAKHPLTASLLGERGVSSPNFASPRA